MGGPLSNEIRRKVIVEVSERRQNIAPQFTVGFCD